MAIDCPAVHDLLAAFDQEPHGALFHGGDLFVHMAVRGNHGTLPDLQPRDGHIGAVDDFPGHARV